ncbi:K02A2.6-like [Cordylochernes scorpioides]|uniref:K02A2.6-like n=1 Tax=Cordylochernes scorpioides TaxID=51811 RepID=A0ABY6LW40_9ARAC|nr:K02A2.6-like [Cordylochernes scorpioides]
MNGIRHTKTSPYNPNTNGLAERYVREFKNLLRKNNGKDDLETNLQSFLFAHRVFPQTVIKEFPGGTANEKKFKINILEFNTKMRNPQEVFHEVVRRQEQFTTGCEVYFRNYATGPKRNGGRKARLDVWFWGQLPLTITSKYTYLGYQLTASNSTQQAAKHFKKKALNAINAVWAISTKKRINSIISSLKLLDSMALSTLLYAAPIWANNQKNLVDRGTILKSPNEQDIDQLIESFSKIDELNQTCKIYKPNQRDPTIVIKNVNKSTDISDLTNIICEMNPELNNFKNVLKVLFPIKSNKPDHDVVLRVSPRACQAIMKANKIYTDVQRCKVRDKVLHCSMAYWLKVITALLIIGCIELNPGPKRQATLTNMPHSTPDQAPMDDLKLLIINLSAEVNRLGDKMDARLLNIEQKMKDWERRMTGIETSIASCRDALATNTRSISHNTLKIRNLEERAEALERRARENNLIIYGIESAETDSRELLLQKVKKLMAEDMQITDDVVIAEYHRLGRGPKAPILIEVPDHESRISLLKNSSKLRILNIFMSRDYSPQIREQRKFLIEKRKELYKKGIGSKLRDNKLLLNGINYMVVEGQVVNAKGEPI